MIEIKVFLGDRLTHKTAYSKARITIGRSEDNDLVLADKLVSRLHAVIEKKDGRLFLADHSRNGTQLDKARVHGICAIGAKCVIGIYPFTLHLSAFPDESTHPRVKENNSEETAKRSILTAESPAVTLHLGFLAGEDPEMLRIYELIRRVADSAATVLILGESGTGKELAARAIHSTSSRREGPFVALDCAAIPDHLIESELFGFEKGAFTGASAAKKGWFEEANGGTIFLDEAGDLSLPAQAKLLRFLQDKTFTRLGGTKLHQADVRVVAATNKDLNDAIQKGSFRSDLYFRLRGVEIRLPPLRERRADIPLLSQHILSAIERENNLPYRPALTAGALARLEGYRWPGNVRQLQNTLHNAFFVSSAPEVIDAKDLDLPEAGGVEPAPLEALSRQLLISTLKDCGGDTAKAASILKVSRGTIYYRCKKLGINIKEHSQ